MTDPWKQQFDHQDCEIIQREVMYQGVFRLVKLHLRHRLFQGGWSDVLQREVFERLTAAAVLLYDPHLDRVVMIEQFRPGALKDARSPWQFEIVAGVIHQNEQPDDIARREAQEEAGCEVLSLELISHYFVSPGGSNEYIHIFYGKIDATNVGGFHGLADEHEDIRVITISSDDAIAQLQQGKIKNAPTIIALQWLALNRDKLKNTNP